MGTNNNTNNTNNTNANTSFIHPSTLGLPAYTLLLTVCTLLFISTLRLIS